MRAIICDKCKKVLAGKEEMKNIVEVSLGSEFAGEFNRKHLCKECEKEFYKWLDKKHGETVINVGIESYVNGTDIEDICNTIKEKIENRIGEITEVAIR